MIFAIGMVLLYTASYIAGTAIVFAISALVSRRLRW